MTFSAHVATVESAPTADGTAGAGGSRFPSWAVVAIAVALCAAGVAVAMGRYGVGMTPDSVVYLDGARNIADGNGYVQQNGSAITSFAPGYSAVLAAGDRLGVDPSDGAFALGVITFVVTVLLAFVLVRRHVRTGPVQAGALLLIGCSAVLLDVFDQALSEHLFLITVLLLLLVGEELLRRPTSLKLFAAAVVLVWAGFYLRFAGIVLVGFMALIVFMSAWKQGWPRAALRALVFASIGMGVPALWMVRNVDAGGSPLGPREDAAVTPIRNIGRTAVVLSGWVAFDAPVAARLAIVAVLVVALAAIVWQLRGETHLLTRTRDLWVLSLFVVVYVGYLIATASVVAFGAINTRFLSPVFVPLVVLGAAGFERVRDRVGDGARRALTIGVCAWVALSLVWFGASVADARRNGAGGYATAQWHDSQLMNDVETLGTENPVVTNDTAAIQLFTDRYVPLSVERTFFNSNTETGRLGSFIQMVECRGLVKLVWFAASNRPRLYTPQQLGEHLDVEVAVQRRDGVIYDLTPRDTNSTEPCR